MSEQSVVPTAVFGRVPRHGVVAGLSWRQLAVMAAAVMPAVWSFTTGFGRGLSVTAVWALPLALLGSVSWQGRSLLDRLMVEGLFVMRMLGGQTTARVNIARRRAQGTLAIPGALGERSYVLDLVGVEYGAGASFVWDGVDKTATAVLQFETDGWALASDEDKAARAAGFTALVGRLAELGGITRMATYARAHPVTGASLPGPRRTEGPAGKWVAQEHASLVTTEEIGRAWRCDMLLTLTLDTRKAAAEIAAGGGGLEGVSHVLAQRVAEVGAYLPACGARKGRARWLGAGHINAAVRLAFDPAAAGSLHEAGWFAGQDMVLATAVDEKRSYLVTDTAFHRTWWVESYPSHPAYAGFFDPLITQSKYARTVTSIWEGIDEHTSEKNRRNAEASRQVFEKLSKKIDKDTTAAHSAEGRELELRRAELENGYTDVAFSTWITVHAATKKELDQSDAWVRTNASGMGVKVLGGQQWACFNTAVLPLGVGARR